MTHLAIAQKAAHMAVALVVADRVETAVDNYTEIDSDSIAVQVGSMVVGQLVANRTDKFTNPMIEKAASRIAKFKNRKNTES